jgi:RNA polymerase sigma-70 factor (ECF subfamily)
MPVAEPDLHERGTTSATAGLAIDLERAIATLPQRAREVFVLFDVEGYGHEDIARMTGIAVGTSKAQLFRARRLLRERLEQ